MTDIIQSITKDFEERVLKRFGTSGRINRLMLKMNEFNKSFDRLREFLEERDDNNEKEE